MQRYHNFAMDSGCFLNDQDAFLQGIGSKVISFLRSMEGGGLSTKLLKYYGCASDIVSPSAFVQQGHKIREENFPMLFSLFAKNSDPSKPYKGLCLIAADGSDVQIPINPSNLDSFFIGANGQPSYSKRSLPD